jgi:hypothetical protein
MEAESAIIIHIIIRATPVKFVEWAGRKNIMGSAAKKMDMGTHMIPQQKN